MPKIGEFRSMYPGGDPENGPRCRHIWDGEHWVEYRPEQMFRGRKFKRFARKNRMMDPVEQAHIEGQLRLTRNYPAGARRSAYLAARFDPDYEADVYC